MTGSSGLMERNDVNGRRVIFGVRLNKIPNYKMYGLLSGGLNVESIWLNDEVVFVQEGSESPCVRLGNDGELTRG